MDEGFDNSPRVERLAGDLVARLQISFSPLDEPASYSYHIPVIEMATKNISSNITSDTTTPAVDSSTKQRGSTKEAHV